MGAAACQLRQQRVKLGWSTLIALSALLSTTEACSRCLSSVHNLEKQGQKQQHDVDGSVIGSHHRQLLQSSYVVTVCDDYSGSADHAAVKGFASKLLGDSRLQLADARFSGACNAFGLATVSQPHALANFFGGAVVLSTGNAAAAIRDVNGGSTLVSADLQQSGDARIGSYTYDAAVLEIDISIAGSSTSNSNEVVLSYLFASEEYGSTTPNPDAFSIAAKTSSGSGYTDVAILPGGMKIPPPSASGSSLPVGLYSNTGSRYRTALNGFTEVVPSQGFPVLLGGSYTLRISVADANNGLVDSVVMLPVGGLKLLVTPSVSAGGPYAVAPNTQLTLNGAKSTSDNGAILQYLWRIFPFANTTAITTAKGPTVTLQAPAVGQYNVTLDVWDVLGGHANVSTALSVDAANVLDWWSAAPSFATPTATALPKPIAELALNGSTGSSFAVKARSGAGAVVQLDGSASSDVKGSKLAYAWSITQTQPSVAAVDPMLGFNQPAKFVYSFDSGAYLITLDVSGPGGTSTAQAMLTVLGNSPPVASAGGPYTTPVGAAVLVSAEQSADADGDPLTYSWVLYRGDLPIGNYSGPALNMKLNKAGTYTLKLTVADDRGGAATTMATLTTYERSAAPAGALEVAAPPLAAPAAATTTVVAAVPAPAPSSTASTSRLRLPSTTPPTPTYTPSVYQPAVYTPPVTSSINTGGALSGAAPSATPPAHAPLPGPAMCLFTREGNSSASPWEASRSDANWSNLNTLSMANTYWAPCQQSTAAPVSGSDAAQAAAGAATEPLASSAVIRSPEAFVTATGAATQVYLDATGSTAAAGRSLIAFSWSVLRTADGAAITQVDGLRTPIWLGPGSYTVKLTVTDTSGQTAAASRDFALGDVAETLAYISSPGSFVEQADGNALEVQLSAAGSKGGPGRSITSYRWVVVRLPDNARVSAPAGPSATVSVPVGSYRAHLAVFDSGGGNATASKDFVVGSRGPGGVAAVIAWPPALVLAAAGSNSLTTVVLDGSGSAPASSRGTISQYIWAVVSMPNKQPVANATGRLTTINVPAGSYQVGLLVADSDGNTATARKNFATSSTPAGANSPPVVKAGLAFSSTMGGSLKIAGVSDPDGDVVAIMWALMDQATGKTTQGKGDTVSLAGQAAGRYLLLITAKDGRGGEASGTAAVTVLSRAGTPAPPPAAVPAALPSSTGSSSSGARLPAAQQPPPASSSASTAAGAAAIKRLPAVTLPRGAVMELDAESFGLLPAGATLDAFMWELKQRSSGEQVATLYGKLGRFQLSAVDTYDLRLTAYDTKGKGYSSTGSVEVVAPTTSGLNSWTSFAGTCGPFLVKQYTTAPLSCPSLIATGAHGKVSYAWTIIAPNGAVSSKTGVKPSVVGLGPGHYRVELAVGVNGAPTGQNTAYYLVTYLKVQANNKLLLSMPQPLCAGQAVSLTAPPLVQQDASEPQYSWQVAWLESQQQQGYREVLRGEGSTFGFTLQTGHYGVLMLARMADGSVIQGVGNITALPCMKCRTGVVNITLPAGKCAADNFLARQALLAPVPAGAAITWARGTSTKPGQRKVRILAKSAAANMSSSCSATVNVIDAEPPAVRLLRPGGACVAPPNSRWACWRAGELVSLSDNCPGDIGFMVQCGEGSTGDNCRVLAGGHVCVRAAKAGQLVRLRVLARDLYGNMAQLSAVPVQVMAAAPAGAGCVAASFSKPEDAAVAKQQQR